MVVSRTDSELWHIQNPRYINNPFIPVKLCHIKIADTYKILVYWEPETFSEQRESLKYNLHIIFFNPAIEELEACFKPYQISIM